MRVGLDLDGVCYQFKEAFSAYLISEGHSQCTLQRAHPNWNFFEGWGHDLQQYLEHFKRGVDSGAIFRSGFMYPGASEATHALVEAGHEVHIITDRSIGTRQGESARATAAWLAENDFVFHSLTFSKDKTCVKTDIYIDDKVENYIALNSAGTTCLLADREWNQADHPAWNSDANPFNPFAPPVDSPMRVASVGEFANRIINDNIFLQKGTAYVTR